MKKNSPKIIVLYFGVLILLFLVVFNIYAWTEPITNSPGGNVAPPINTSGDAQIKTGPLQVNGFLNVGDTSLAKLDVRGTTKIGTNVPAAGQQNHLLCWTTNGTMGYCPNQPVAGVCTPCTEIN